MIVGSDEGVRTMKPVPSRSRRKCNCCRKRATHVGLGDGVALMSGCEWSVRTWVRDPRAHITLMRRAREKRPNP